MALIDDTRSAWGARASTNPQHVAAGSRVGISWHYPGGSSTITPSSDHKRCLSQVLAWQRFHQSSRGWADLGYNALICQHARVIEGRGLDLIGAHSPGVNVTHYGVQFMVSGDTLPTPAMLKRAVQLRADLEKRSGRTLRQWGHRDDPAASTACPGDAIERWVKTGGPYAALKPTNPAPSKETAMTLTPADVRVIANTDDIFNCPDKYKGKGNDYWTLNSYQRVTLNNVYANGDQIRALRAELKGLTAAVQALATAHGANGDAVVAAVREQVAQALKGIELTLTVSDDGV